MCCGRMLVFAKHCWHQLKSLRSVCVVFVCVYLYAVNRSNWPNSTFSLELGWMKRIHLHSHTHREVESKLSSVVDSPTSVSRKMSFLTHLSTNKNHWNGIQTGDGQVNEKVICIFLHPTQRITTQIRLFSIRRLIRKTGNWKWWKILKTLVAIHGK